MQDEVKITRCAGGYLVEIDSAAQPKHIAPRHVVSTQYEIGKLIAQLWWEHAGRAALIEAADADVPTTPTAGGIAKALSCGRDSGPEAIIPLVSPTEFAKLENRLSAHVQDVCKQFAAIQYRVDAISGSAATMTDLASARADIDSRIALLKGSQHATENLLRETMDKLRRVERAEGPEFDKLHKVIASLRDKIADLERIVRPLRPMAGAHAVGGMP